MLLLKVHSESSQNIVTEGSQNVGTEGSQNVGTEGSQNIGTEGSQNVQLKFLTLRKFPVKFSGSSDVSDVEKVIQ
jgi:hypothetical protein